MKTYWLEKEDDTRVKKRFGEKVFTLNRTYSNCQQSQTTIGNDVAPDLICNNTAESDATTLNQIKLNRQDSFHIRERARSSYNSIATIDEIPNKKFLNSKWATHSVESPNKKRCIYGSTNDADKIYFSSPRKRLLERSVKHQPYLVGGNSKIYCSDPVRAPRSAPQITFM